MNIYTILSSKPHNTHYLIRYINFINSRDNNKTGYTEKHHICPKAMDLFPEYGNLIRNLWNSVVLTAREHFIAHWLLWKAFPKTTMSTAFILMGRKNSNRLNSKSYQSLKEEYSIINSESQIGRKWDSDIPHFNKGRICTPETKKLMSLSRKNRTHKPISDEARKNISIAQKKRFSNQDTNTPINRMEGKNHSDHTKTPCRLPEKGGSGGTMGPILKCLNLAQVRDG